MITHDQLLKTLHYNPKTGIFTWLIDIGYKKQNTIAGTQPSFGYSTIHIQKKNYYAHRLAWFYTYNEWPNNIIDHKNRNRQDNSIDNLRDITTQENNNNKTKQIKIVNGKIIFTV